jgi:hypothetical protein
MSFFSSAYRPLAVYRCQNLAIGHAVSDAHLAALMSQGHSFDAAYSALQVTHDDMARAERYLQLGRLEESSIGRPVDLDYSTCPLAFLVPEVVDAFIDLTDHCCVCGGQFGIAGLKPALCNNELCFFGCTEIAIGPTVLAEIRRDPLVADFLVWLPSACYGTKFFRPPLTPQLDGYADRFFRTLPQMGRLERCCNDAALIEFIGLSEYKILRFILISNRPHLMCLPEHLKLKECAGTTTQFLVTVDAPDREMEFQRKKNKCGTTWLWHGSFLNRWHSILHTGLMDLGGTRDRTHGGPGDGIYDSNQSMVSWSYSQSAKGNDSTYARSVFRSSMAVLALVENINGRGLHQRDECEWTQSDPSGLVVRVIMVAEQPLAWDVQKNPPGKIPSLRECLAYLADCNGGPTATITELAGPKLPSFEREAPRKKYNKRAKKGKKRR